MLVAATYKWKVAMRKSKSSDLSKISQLIKSSTSNFYLFGEIMVITRKLKDNGVLVVYVYLS